MLTLTPPLTYTNLLYIVHTYALYSPITRAEFNIKTSARPYTGPSINLQLCAELVDGCEHVSNRVFGTAVVLAGGVHADGASADEW